MRPSVFFTLNQGGVSNYATVLTTAPFFSIGFLGFAACLVKAASRINEASFQIILRTLGIGYILLVASTYPYKLNPVFENIHIFIAGLFGLYQYAVCSMLAKQSGLNLLTGLFTAFACASLVIGLLTMFDVVRLLFTSQLLLGIAIGGLLIHKSSRIRV